jgi:hypothetical protein
MAIIVSFKNFLRTGRLGPISIDLGPNDLGNILGSPDVMTVGNGLPFPDTWMYGKLEFCFVCDPDDAKKPLLWFFQIEYANQMTGDCEVIPVGGGGGGGLVLRIDPTVGQSTLSHTGIGDALVIDLEGLDGRSRIPAFLDALRGCPAVEVRIRRLRGYADYSVIIANGPVEIVMEFELEETSDAECAAFTDSELARTAAEYAVLDSIYVYASERDARMQPDFEVRVIPASIFLEAVGR